MFNLFNHLAIDNAHEWPAESLENVEDWEQQIWPAEACAQSAGTVCRYNVPLRIGFAPLTLVPTGRLSDFLRAFS